MNRSEEIPRLLAEYRRTGKPEVLERLVVLNRGIVLRLARRFTPQPVVAYEDLVQVGCLGLLQAIERFDPGRGQDFLPFAVATILGVIRHSLRDEGWTLHAPRRTRELVGAVRSARSRWEALYGQSPSIEDLATRLNVPEEEVCRALDLDRYSFTRSLDEVGEESEASRHQASEALFLVESGYDAIVERAAWCEILSRLQDSERRVILGRYYEDRTQADVAARLGISQMQVSRLERRALANLRGLLASETPKPACATIR